MFPKNVPRYGKMQSVPTVVRSPGEVKIQSVKDIQPLDEQLAKFPGPLKGKSKKKETLAWLSGGIEGLEAGLPQHLSFQTNISHDEKRAVERLLLWKILRVFIEHDGTLDGNPTVDQAVRDVLSPKIVGQAPDGSTVFTTGASMASMASQSTSQILADGVSPSALGEIKSLLLAGEREKAVWSAADKRLWGHAMLIASTVSPDLYKQVTQEFVKKEVNYPGRNNESLAALYEVLSGNHEECVDELVPVHARAGLQLVAKDSTVGVSNDVTDGLDKWQETLGLILSNRSPDDARAINSLGNLLSSYGRAEAAHICFIFARTHSVFGGLDDPNSNFVLVGSDHKRQTEQFAKEIEPLLLSEVYEYGLSLAGVSTANMIGAHLAGYKLQHALTLAEYGYRDKALQYCETIANAITAQTRRSPYHHPVLEMAVEDLVKRLKLSPKGESNSWISKPSMNKVSDSVWNRFNKFVAGDDNDSSGPGTPQDGTESGPFARIAGGTPTISRSPSVQGLETFGAPVPGYPMGNIPMAATAPPLMPATRAGSRYAPVAAQPNVVPSNAYDPSSAYMPRPSVEQPAHDLNRGSLEMSRTSSDMQSGFSNMCTPPSTASPIQNYQPSQGSSVGLSRESSYMPIAQPEEYVPSAPNPAPSAYEPLGKVESTANGSPYAPSTYGASSYAPTPYAPVSAAPSAENVQSEEDSQPTTTGYEPPSTGYQPPSYGYEPPSFTPYEASAEKAEDTQDEPANGGYEAPSYQPYGYEPPSYQPDLQPSQGDGDSDSESKPKPKKKGIMYDDDEDDYSPARPAESDQPREKTKEEKDRENAEMFRRVAEEEGKPSTAHCLTKCSKRESLTQRCRETGSRSQGGQEGRRLGLWRVVRRRWRRRQRWWWWNSFEERGSRPVRSRQADQGQAWRGQFVLL
jgi:hypothetical protein